MILRKSSPLHVYSILHVYWYWYVDTSGYFRILCDCFGIALELFWQCFGILWDCFGILWECFEIPLWDLEILFNHVYITEKLFVKKNSSCMVLFWSARLLILRKFSPLHVYFFLHSSLILVCTFINFEKKFPPARSYFGLHVYWFWDNFPTCTFISYCTSIRYTRVPCTMALGVCMSTFCLKVWPPKVDTQ